MLATGNRVKNIGIYVKGVSKHLKGECLSVVGLHVKLCVKGLTLALTQPKKRVDGPIRADDLVRAGNKVRACNRVRAGNTEGGLRPPFLKRERVLWQDLMEGQCYFEWSG